MKKRVFLTVLVMAMALSASSTAAQGFLPTSFGGWTASSTAPVVAPEQLESIAGERSALLRELGVTSVEQSQYTQGQQQTVSVTLYRMVDPTAAFGAFTVLRDSQMTRVDLGDSASYTGADGNRACFVVGNLLLMISGAGQRPEDAALTDLAAALLPRADGRPYPHISGFLPANPIPGSERFVLGPRGLAEAVAWAPPGGADWMGYSRSAESAVARYRADGHAGRAMTLILTLYPTQQVAADQFRTFSRWVAINGQDEQANGRPIVFAGRKTALVALVMGAESLEAANELLGQVRYRSVVTWNEPGHALTDPGFPTMIIGVFQGTGLIALLAFAAGLGFGGFRLLVKALFPGRVFDRSSQVEILQLGLSSKPINSRDFY